MLSEEQLGLFIDRADKEGVFDKVIDVLHIDISDWYDIDDNDKVERIGEELAEYLEGGEGDLAVFYAYPEEVTVNDLLEKDAMPHENNDMIKVKRTGEKYWVADWQDLGDRWGEILSEEYYEKIGRGGYRRSSYCTELPNWKNYIKVDYDYFYDRLNNLVWHEIYDNPEDYGGYFGSSNMIDTIKENIEYKDMLEIIKDRGIDGIRDENGVDKDIKDMDEDEIREEFETELDSLDEDDLYDIVFKKYPYLKRYLDTQDAVNDFFETLKNDEAYEDVVDFAIQQYEDEFEWDKYFNDTEYFEYQPRDMGSDEALEKIIEKGNFEPAKKIKIDYKTYCVTRKKTGQRRLIGAQ